MASSGEIRAGKAYIEIGTKDSFSKDFKDVENRLRSIGSSLTNLGTKMGALGSAITAPLLVAAQRFASMGNEIYRASQRTGISIQNMQQLKYAVEQSGASFQDFENGIKRMQRTLIDAAEGSQQAQDALKILGLRLADLAKLSPDQQFKVIADRINGLNNAGVEAGVVMQIFSSRFSTSIIPMLKQGSAGMEALQKRAQQLGITFSDADARAATTFTQTLNDLWQQLQAVTFQIGAAIAGALQPFATASIKVMTTIIGWVKENRNLAISALALGVGLTALGSGILGVGLALKLTATAMAGFRAGISAITTAVGLLANPIVLVGLAIVGLAAYFAYTTQVGQRALSFLGQKFQELKKVALTAFGGIADALSSGDILLAANILWTGLKLAWATGTQELQAKWIEFKNQFTQVAIAAFYGASEIWANVKADLEDSWQNMTAVFGNVWDAFIGIFTDSWNKAVNLVTHGINKIHHFFNSGFDSDAANAQADKMMDDKSNAQQQREMSAQKKREEDRARSIADIEAARSKAIAQIQKEEIAMASGANANTKSDIAELEKHKAELEKQLAALRAQAAKEKTSSGNMPLFDPRKGIDLDDVKNLIQPIKSTGTFNASAGGLLGLNSDSKVDRIAKATEETARNTRKKNQNATPGQSGLVYY